jgi:putative ABC transport system permease protein
MISWFFEIAARIRSLFTGSAMDRLLEEELDAHIALLTDENIHRGLAPDAARREALLAVGNRSALKEMHRDVRSLRFVEDLLRDARHSVRLMRRNVLFTLVAAVSLAIGIGADVTVFTAANALLLRVPEGVAQPERLVDISRTMNQQFGVFELSYPDYQDIRRRTTTLEDVYLYEPMTTAMSVAGPDGSDLAYGMTVSLNYFDTLGVTPAAGQLFQAAGREDSRNNPFVVLSYAFWQRRFKGDAGIIGRTIQVNGEYLQVVGVAAQDFHGTSIVSPDFWLPIGWTPNDLGRFNMREVGWALVGGRLKKGVTVGQASAELHAIAIALTTDYPNSHSGFGLKATAPSMIPGNLVLAVTGIFTLLMAFVSLVLLIACGNMASVLLSRAVMRRGELAVRLAIGAGRARIVRQLLTETVLIFMLGAGAGLLLSRGLTALIISNLPNAGVPINLSVSMDIRILVFTFGLSFFSAVLCGLTPALQASKSDVVSTLKTDGQTVTQHSWLQNAFVIGQVAFSILLVVAAGLFIGALKRLSSLPLGYDPANVEIATLDLSSLRTTARAETFIRELSERIRALPGVQESTIATFSPIDAGRTVVDLRRPGDGKSSPPQLPDLSTRVSWNFVEPGYFATMKIPLLAGRDFTPADRESSEPVAIVSQKMARRFWPGEDPVGRYLPASLGDTGTNALVIGIARDVLVIGVPESSAPVAYRPLMQRYIPHVTIAVRSIDGHRLAGAIRTVVFSLNPNIPILTTETLESAVSAAMLPQRNAAAVTGSLGIVGLVLASLGVYGIMTHTVTRRTREIGVRIALGARRRQVTQLVLREGISLVGIGSAIGLFLAYVANRTLRSSPLNVPDANITVYAAAAGLFLVVGLIACWTPVRRATRIDAIAALRHE